MNNDGHTSPVRPPSSADRLPAPELLALVLGRDVVRVPDAVGDGAPEPAPGTLLPPSLQLFVLSFLMLFVELALIRWSGALVLYLCSPPEKHSKPGTTRIAKHAQRALQQRVPNIRFWNAAAPERCTVGGVPNGGYACGGYGQRIVTERVGCFGA